MQPVNYNELISAGYEKCELIMHVQNQSPNYPPKERVIKNRKKLYNAFRFIFISLITALCLITLYAFCYLTVPDIWTKKIDLKKLCTCESPNLDFDGYSYFPNSGGPDWFFTENEIKEMCPTANIDFNNQTIIISRGKEITNFRIKPLLKWRLSKTWVYGYPSFSDKIDNTKLFFYVITIVNVGKPL